MPQLAIKHRQALGKNNKTGVKILMSGGTRCTRLTTLTRAELQRLWACKEILAAKFRRFLPQAVVEFLNQQGIATSRSTGKVFPVSNRAVHVRDALHRYAVDSGVEIRTGCVTRIRPDGSGLLKRKNQPRHRSRHCDHRREKLARLWYDRMLMPEGLNSARDRERDRASCL